MTDAVFDPLLGGQEAVPPILPLKDFCEHRIDEILMLADAINDPGDDAKRRLFQRLPKHMRRRQMSHHNNRMPRRLREKISSQKSLAVDPPSKRPSRKYRRKPNNLLLEYNRRQRGKVWLETHIWHAKRFHMIEKWGYRLGDKPTNKGFRANYRASSSHCLLTDLSYNNVIELIGKQEVLLAELQKCCDTRCGLTFAAKYYLDGCRQGSVILYHPGSYPYGVIGEVIFLWKPVTCEGDSRRIWIIVHPAIHDEIVNCFQQLFSLMEDTSRSQTMMPTVATKESSKLSTKNIPFNRVPCFKSVNVEMNLLKDTLNIFRLVGPLSSSVLCDALKFANFTEDTIDVPAKRCKYDESVVEIDMSEVSWVEKLRQDSEWNHSCLLQREIFDGFQKLTSPTQLPPRSVLSVLARDPRLTLPIKRTKSVPKKEDQTMSQSNFIREWHVSYAKSPIWNEKIRDEVTTTKQSTFQLNQVRSQRVIACEGEDATVLPLLIIQRPGNSDGYSSGWDVICPAGWGLDLWVSFILRGARAGGLRETQAITLESGNLRSIIHPDSVAGRSEAEEMYNSEKQKFKNFPPSKRPNYNKLGIPSPFRPLWSELLQFWTKIRPEMDDEEGKCRMYVLRDRKVLTQIADSLKRPKSTSLVGLTKDFCNAYIPVKATTLSGRPCSMAHIYLPNLEDFDNYKQGQTGPIEANHCDEGKTIRKELVQKHRSELKTQRRRRKKERQKLKEEVANQPLGTKLPEGFFPKIKQVSRRDVEWEETLANLWLPDEQNVLNIMEKVSRRLAGYVLYGDFSFSSARGVGLGYMPFLAVKSLVEFCAELDCSPLILVRNTGHFQYRFAKIEIVLN